MKTLRELSFLISQILSSQFSTKKKRKSEVTSHDHKLLRPTFISFTPVTQLLIYLLLLLSYFSVDAVSWKNDRPIVNVEGQGRIIGVEEHFGNFTYYAFRKIPFAQLPIGQLRFKDPVETEGWEEDLDGAFLPPPCTQKGNSNSSEDCLYVNVYVPQEALKDVGEPLAVLAYIHGGAFVVGSGEDFDPCHVLLEKGVIMVSLQYRLGILGFLSTEDSSAPGNLGLKDQTMALKWIKNHINSFGGDSNKITIFGESAGSYSVHYQVLVPSAAGLFRGAIMESGTALCPGAHGRDFLKNALDIAAIFGCPQSPSEDLVACLQEQSAVDLTNMNDKFSTWIGHPRMFAPRVDGDYIPDVPVRLLQEKRYNKVPVIMGINRDEGAMLAVDWYKFPIIIASLLHNFDENAPLSLELLPEEDPISTANEVYEYYLPGRVIGKDQADNATMMNGHRHYLIGTDWAVELMAPDVPVFMYELHHRGQHGHMDSYLDGGLDLPPAKNWISHADELQYLFEWWWGPLETEEDLAVRDIFATTWTNFAKTLDPTPDDSLGYKWTAVEIDNPHHFTIMPTPAMEEDSRLQDREFWNGLPLRDNPHK